MIQETLNQLADDHLPADTPFQRIMVMKGIFQAIEISEGSTPADVNRLRLWKQYFDQVHTDLSEAQTIQFHSRS